MTKMFEKNNNLQEKNFNLPNNIDLEKEFLSCIISANDNDLIDEAISDLQEDDFYDNDTKAIFKACKKLIEEEGCTSIDLTLLKEELIRNNKSDLTNILSDIVSNNKSFIEAREYKDKLINYSYIRRIIFSVRKIQKEAEELPDYKKLLAIFESELNYLLGYRILEDNLKHISDATASFIIQRTEELKNDKRNVFPTGLKTLDNLLNDGFKPGQLAIVAARPGCGKTAFALNIICNSIRKYSYTSNKEYKPVIALFNQEMSKEELVQRIIANIRDVELSKLTKASTTDVEVKHNINEANKIFDSTNIYIDDTAGIFPEQISVKCKKLKRKHNKLDLVIIDYLQLLKSKEKTQSRQYEVAEISRFMKILAKELKVPVIVLSQLSRDLEKREDIKGATKQPKLSDLRDSGAIEQDADIVIFLSNPTQKIEDEFSEEFSKSRPKDVLLSLAKNRNGSQGYLNLSFEGIFMRFTEKKNNDNTVVINSEVTQKEKITQEKLKKNQEIKKESQIEQFENKHEENLLEHYTSIAQNSDYIKEFNQNLEGAKDLNIDEE